MKSSSTPLSVIGWWNSLVELGEQLGQMLQNPLAILQIDRRMFDMHSGRVLWSAVMYPGNLY